MNYVTELEERLIDDSTKYIQANEEKICSPQVKFQIGDYVEHKVFGMGEIIDIKKDISSIVVKFEKSKTERNLSLKAPLTIVKK